MNGAGTIKRSLTVLWGLLLFFSLTGCGGKKDDGQPQASSSVYSQSSGQTSSNAAVGSRQGAADPAQGSQQPESAEGAEKPEVDPAENSGRFIKITTEAGDAIVFLLNDSKAADALLTQLPLQAAAESYGSNEIIFYPPNALDAGDAPPAQGPAGTLAYYAPWGNVAIFYGACDGASGLFELGTAVSGTEYISEITGELQVEAISASSPSQASAAPEDAESPPQSEAIQGSTE